jgi:hypothetical protein
MKADPPRKACFRVSAFILYPSYLLLVCCGVVAPSAARAGEFSQVSHYNAGLFWRGTLFVDTRIGDVRVEGWDKPGVEIDAEKVVQAGSEEGARKLFEQIQIQLNENGEEVFLRALFPPRRPWRLFRGATKLSVNFRIRMPYEAKLTLQCVDGDVRVSGIAGHQQIRVSYGDVEVTIPSVPRLHSLDARAFLGYVQSDLHGEDSAGWGRQISFLNAEGDQDIQIRVRLGGVYVYRTEK